jgi:hypothetical protein
MEKQIKNPSTNKYTLASRLCQRLNQSLQESIYFSTRKRNSIIFYPTVRCFNFFPTAQATTDKQSDCLLQTLTALRNLVWTREARTANMVLPKAGVTCFYDTFVLNRTLVFQINSSAEMPRLRQYPKRYASPYDDRKQTDRQK